MEFIPTSINIREFILVESGTYNPQYRRSYTTDEMETSAIDELRDRLRGGRVRGPGQLAGYAGQIVRVSAVPSHELRLDNTGWGGRRFAFMMSVDIYAQGSNTPTRQLLMGYSENTEMTLNRTIDPYMKFTINSIATLKSVTTIDRGRRVTTMVPKDCSHLLASNEFDRLREDTEIRIDPRDVMGLMMVGKDVIDVDEDERVHTFTGVHSTSPVKVSREFSRTANYLSSILKGFGTATITADDHGNQLGKETEHADLCTRAMNTVTGSKASNDGFLMAIRSVSPTGYMTNNFTLKDLEKLQPNHVCDVFMQGETVKTSKSNSRYKPNRLGDNAHEENETDDWGGSNLLSQTAAILSHTVPGLMMELFITEARFRATNKTSDNSILIVMVDVPRSIEEFDSRKLLETFEARLEVEIFNDVGMNGTIDFDVEFYCDLMTECWISIQLGDDMRGTFNTPTFCDALMTPMLTSMDNASLLAGDLNGVMGDLVLGQNRNHSAFNEAVSDKPFRGNRDDRRDNGGSRKNKINIITS